MKRLPNYLRTYRRRWRLTQEELAFILGYRGKSMVARLEQDGRVITLAVAHACCVLFDVEPRDLFPAFLARVEDDLYRRLCDLRDELLLDPPARPTSVELLREAIDRIAKLRKA